jgi:hypothetical protein
VNGSSEIKSRHVLGFIASRFRDVMSNTFPFFQLYPSCDDLRYS